MASVAQNASRGWERKMSSTAISPVLDTFLPGVSMLLDTLTQYFNIDVTYYLSVLLGLFALVAGINYCINPVWETLSRFLVSTAEIRMDDEIYSMLMFWVSKQKFAKESNRLIAGTRLNTALWDYDDDDAKADGPDLLLDEDGIKDYEEKALNWEDMKNVHFTPAYGTRYFRHKGRFFAFIRSKADKPPILFGPAVSDEIYITCLGKNPQPIKELLHEAQKSFIERDGNKTVIYRGTKNGGSPDDIRWVRCLSRPPRSLSTVVLDRAQKEMIIEDMKDYLHPATRLWYSNRGIPYRRGYLLHGPPGTGKTSLCFAAAGMLRLKIYLISLNSRTLTEDGFASLFRELPWRCIVLLEDIDAAGLTNKRSDNPTTNETEKDTSTKASNNGSNTSNQPTLSLSAFLNVIDGVASSEGRILIMTTNHIEKLDPAMLRPGRVDMTVEFSYADTAMVRDLFKAIYVSLDYERPAKAPFTAANGSATVQEKSDIVANGSAMPSTKGDEPRAQDVKSDTQQQPGVERKASRRKHIHHGRTDEEIDALAGKFATMVPSKEFTPAEVQGYLLRHKRDPDGAVDGVEAWIARLREEKEKQKAKKAE